MRILLIGALLLPAFAGIALAQDQATPPTLSAVLSGPDAPKNFRAIQERFNEYFSRVPPQRGSGYNQYKRWEWFVEPRTYPSGELINTTALTWIEHYDHIRSPLFAQAQQLGMTAGITNGNWQTLGPSIFNNGPQGYSPGMGRINAVAVASGNPSTLYVGAPVGGLWRSQDGGGTWKALTDGLPDTGISDIAIDPTSPSTIYLLTGDSEARNIPSIGMVKSTDGGTTWQLTGLTWNRNQQYYGYRLAISPSNGQLFAATTVGLYASANGGAAWNVVQGGSFVDVVLHPTTPTTIYAATTTTVYRSTDGGARWQTLGGGLPAGGSNRIRLAVTSASPNTIYVLYGASTGFTIGLWRSDDTGDNFTLQSNSPNILGYAQDGHDRPGDPLSQSWYDLAMAVSPSNMNQVNIGGVNTWRSIDGGKTWTNTSYWVYSGQNNYTHADIHTLAYNGATLYAGTDGGVFSSTNNATSWNNITTGIATTQIYRICTTPHAATLSYFGAQDNGSNRYSLNGQQMTQVLGADGFVCQIDPTDSNNVYVSRQEGDLQASTDGGNHFASIQPANSGKGAWLTPYTLSPSAAGTVLACYADLWRNTTKGTGDWQNLTAGAIGAGKDCRAVVVAPSNASTIYVAKSTALYVSTDGGANWQNITGTLPVAGAQITNVAVSPTNPQRVWVTFSGYSATAKVYATSNGGGAWTNLSAGLPNLPANTAVAPTSAGNGVYVGLDVGVYYRDDTITAWMPYMNGLPNVTVDHLVLDGTGTKIIAASYGRGVWSSDLYTACPVSYNFTPQTAPAVVGQTFYHASQTITSTVAFPGSATINVTYRAGNGILLAPGFSVGAGATFSATIGACGAPVAAAAAPRQAIAEGSVVSYMGSVDPLR